jgi:hypothetical protein
LFSKYIYSTALASEEADRLFSNITESGTPDQSFMATLRALLRNRIPQGETVHFSCSEMKIPADDIIAAPVPQRMNRFVSIAAMCQTSTSHTISIVYAAQHDAGAEMLEVVKANAGCGKSYMSNYIRRDDLQVFYARKVNALFYTDDTQRNSIIFVDKMELKHFHALQMMIPKYLPLLFANNPLTEKETALLKSTGTAKASEYESLIEWFAGELDIRAEIIRTKLAGFETVFERMRADEIRAEIIWHQEDYDNQLSKLRDTSHKIQECKYSLAGLVSVIDGQSGDSELMEYFMCNKNLSIMQVIGSEIQFIAHGYTDIYDIDAFEQYVGNHDGYMYSNLHNSISKPQMEKLYRTIFGECSYKLRICAAYTADIRSGLTAISNYSFPAESMTYFPNPHIQSHGCIGQYAGRFLEYMQKRDYVGAIDQAVVSARNLNFYDLTVISTFAKDFSATKIKCVENPEGTLLTPKEAIIELEGGRH